MFRTACLRPLFGRSEETAEVSRAAHVDVVWYCIAIGLSRVLVSSKGAEPTRVGTDASLVLMCRMRATDRHPFPVMSI
jgi:hypothetical protein